MYILVSLIVTVFTVSYAKDIVCPREGDAYFPDPENWGHFIRCSNGTQTPVECPQDFPLFNREGKFCYSVNDVRTALHSKHRKGLEKNFRCPGHPSCPNFPTYPLPPEQCPGYPHCLDYNPLPPPYLVCPGDPSCPIYPPNPLPPPRPICPGDPTCPVYPPKPLPLPQPICPGDPTCPVYPLKPLPLPQPICPGDPTCPGGYPVIPPRPIFPVLPIQPLPPYPSCPGHPTCPEVLPNYPDFTTCPGYPGYPGYGHPVGQCPFCNDQCEVTFLHDAADCTVFYMCDWGCPIWQRCPPGLHFNRRERVCDYPWRAGCAQTGRPPCQ